LTEIWTFLSLENSTLSKLLFYCQALRIVEHAVRPTALVIFFFRLGPVRSDRRSAFKFNCHHKLNVLLSKIYNQRIHLLLFYLGDFLGEEDNMNGHLQRGLPPTPHGTHYDQSRPPPTPKEMYSQGMYATIEEQVDISQSLYY
jgi:hypothetical protein